MISAPHPISPGATIGPAVLSVTDLARSVDYYRHNIGLTVMGQNDRRALLGAGGPTLLELRSGATSRAVPHAAGLYHFAILMPNRLELARTLAHLIETRTPIGGASDHLVSEALYLSDPDGHGIEIYRDRPRSEWVDEQGNFRMDTVRLDVDGLMGELAHDDRPWDGMDAGTVLGHMHLQVDNVNTARRFYMEVIGLDHMTDYPGASFLSAGGYHHHLGVNMWQSTGRGQAPADAARLLVYSLCVPDEAEQAAVWARIRQSGAATEEWEGDPVVLDPAGNRLRICVAG